MPSAKQASAGSFQIEIVPLRLSARVYRHDVPYFKPVPCLTFVTQGLHAHGQREVILTWRRSTEQGDTLPELPVDIIKNIYALAAQGKVVDSWGYSQFLRESVQDGAASTFQVAYLHPIPLPGIQLPSAALTAIFLSQDDYEVFRAFGLTRLVAARGRHYRYYPCPPWSELPLPKTVSMQSMQGSILAKTPRIHAEGSYATMESSGVTFRLEPRARQTLANGLKEFKPNQPLALLPELDPNANACLAWEPKKNVTVANVTPGSDLSRTAGCFIAFVPEQKEDSLRMIEDGFALLLTTGRWKSLREAITSGQDIAVSTTGKLSEFRVKHLPPAGRTQTSVSHSAKSA
jgi:hypothetical protein